MKVSKKTLLTFPSEPPLTLVAQCRWKFHHLRSLLEELLGSNN